MATDLVTLQGIWGNFSAGQRVSMMPADTQSLLQQIQEMSAGRQSDGQPWTPPAADNHPRDLASALGEVPTLPWANSMLMVINLMNNYLPGTGTATAEITGPPCNHENALADALGRTHTTTWVQLLAEVTRLRNLRNPTTNHGTNLTQMVSAPKVPEFGERTTYDDYKVSYRLYVRSISPTTPLEILAAVTGLMMGWKGEKLTFISNIDPETFLRPTALTATWADSTNRLLEFAK